MRRVFGVIVLACAVVAASACAAQERRSDDHADTQGEYFRPAASPRMAPAEAYAKGVEALKARRYRQAVRALAKVTDMAPNKAAAWRMLGAAYAGEMRWDASRRAYKRAIYLAPDDIVSHAGLGVALLALNDPKAQAQAQWLKARSDACNNRCPEAPVLKALQEAGPFAAPSSMD